MLEPDRNDPCPCGSGKKYKKCCLAKSVAARSQPSKEQEQWVLGLKKMSERKWEEALGFFKSIEHSDVDPFNVLWAMAACYDALEDYPSAAEYFEKALPGCPDSQQFSIMHQLGLARACAGTIDQALAAFMVCRELDAPQEQKSHLDPVIAALEEVRDGKSSINPLLLQVKMHRALSDIEEKRYAEAARKLEKLAGIDPKNAAIFYNLGVVYTLLHREDEAAIQYEKTVELEPDFAAAWYNLGQLNLIRMRDFSRALHCFDRAVAARPDYVGAHHQRGIAWELLGDRAKAVECWQRTLELDPNNKLARENFDRVSAQLPYPQQPPTE